MSAAAAAAAVPGRRAKAAIHWFRKGLRLHDNPALLRACEAAAVYPVFVIDPWFVSEERVGVNRMRFLLETLEDLDAALRARSSKLSVLRGRPEEVLPRAAAHWGADLLTFEADFEPYALQRDEAVRSLLAERGVRVESFVSHSLYDPRGVAAAGPGGKPPLSYGPLADLGYAPPEHAPLFPGGEQEGLRRMAAKLSRGDWVRAFAKPKTSPTAVGEPDTTGLSPYLKFGCVSSRRFWHELAAVNAGGPHGSPPTSLEGQLLWREFYICHGFSFPNYDRMAGNPVCRQIAWQDDPELLRRWEEGTTGFPWIDACMRQLRAQGWLHHLGRHAVACFLTRGDLYQSWERGARVFDRLLVDSDWALNNGNWMWLSASAYFFQFFRVYSPVAFPKHTDPDGDYVRRWVPELANFPKAYIYEPWKASKQNQRKWGCEIGSDYPEPIVDHVAVSKLNMARHKAAYEAHKAPGPPRDVPVGDSPGAFQVGSAPRAPKRARGDGDEGDAAAPGGSGEERDGASAAKRAKPASP
ncbi:hypothetical protein FNF29_03848 [Cafeteria roenbergensis]|uniref:Photolyase/cryptochrome alpha/beta domain-containing protein n=1 Tax=Cafeteria roenbergensis TaxID=33653 RepID=A0A5A8CLB5_CAFRO|nr:hypothetical protein FNF29_03848 [Cafeteria roenbergensis]KAA0165238.1 hypothetical protein FNF28_03519 [Cafeteria roenbergensis]|eukprot:KAA0152621.1 hypothetical protein FNF29_03848 [Cafeteria roenbergensis]